MSTKRPTTAVADYDGAFDVRPDEASASLHVSGELDIATVARLAIAARSHPDASVLDFASLTFIDAAGLGCLVQINTRLQGTGRHLTVRNTAPHTDKIFHIVGLERMLATRPLPPPATQ